MEFTDEEQERLTFREWERLLLVIEDAIDHVVTEHIPGFETLADELLDVKAEIATEVIPAWI